MVFGRKRRARELELSMPDWGCIDHIRYKLINYCLSF